MMKAKEIRNLSVEELTKKLEDLKKDLFMLRMQHAPTSWRTPCRLRLSRRTSPASRPLFVRKRPTSEEVSDNE